MSKKLSDLFNLPPIPVEDTSVADLATIEANKGIIAVVDVAIDKIDAALPTIRDLTASDAELDELAKLATDNFKELMDLGLGCDPRFGGPIFQTAGMLLGHAITAKTAKIDKKLKMVQLQLNKAKLDHVISKDAGDDAPTDPIDGKGMLLDRNALLAQIIENNKKQ
jgi:hypothetical protein